MTLTAAGVITTRQLPTTLPATGGWLGQVARVGGRLVPAQTRHTDRVAAGRTRRGGHDVLRTLPDLPRPRWLGLVLHLDLHVLVALGGAGVAAGEGLVAGQPAARTRPEVAAVRRGGARVSALGRHGAHGAAPRRLDGLLAAAGHGDRGEAAVAGDGLLQLAGVAGAGVAAGRALVILTAQSFPTRLFTGLASSAALPARDIPIYTNSN